MEIITRKLGLGNYKETVYFHDENRSISFGFCMGEELFEYYRYYFQPHSPKSKNKALSYIAKAAKYETYMIFELSKELNSHKTIKTKFHNEVLGDLEIVINTNKSKVLLNDTTKCTLIFKNKTESIILEDIGYESNGFLSIILAYDLKDACKKKQLDESVYYQIAFFLLNQNVLEYYLKNLIYLNPLNTKPQRIYFKKDAQSSFTEINLEKFANQITNNTVSPKILREFSKILAKYGIVDKLKLSISKDFPVAEIRVLIKDLISNIYDVGYGVSLQIPLLFETFLSEQDTGNMFLIEQPEVHLHPSLQAKFIDVILSMGNKNSYVIETHSEHIIRMLQVLVKEKRHNLCPDDVKIYYFLRQEDSFQISEHKILKNGQLETSFPSGFFDTSYKLTKSLMF